MREKHAASDFKNTKHRRLRCTERKERGIPICIDFSVAGVGNGPFFCVDFSLLCRYVVVLGVRRMHMNGVDDRVNGS